ncbi:hypothetical protein H0H87_008496 [Tephrocybe sp. NHM501043]|nr:hypothetical protein H0H87_008496 [Tephrocybe sp. NHM501043]
MGSETLDVGDDGYMDGDLKHTPYLGMTGVQLNIWVTVACTTAMTLFDLTAGHSGENFGRKKTFMIGVIVMSIGAILQTCAYSVAQMIMARLVTGLYSYFIKLDQANNNKFKDSEMG